MTKEYARGVVGEAVYKSPHHDLIDHGDYMVLRRTNVDFDSLDVMREEHQQIISTFPARGPGILIDARAARPRNDAGFEEASKALRVRVVQTFERVALVVETVAGAMQVGRLMRDEGVSNARVFNEQESAIAWLRRSVERRAKL